MKIVNRSRHHQTSKLRLAIEFCARRCEYSDEVTLVLTDRRRSGGETGGLTDARGEPTVVTLSLSRGVKYPQLDAAVPEVGEVRLESLEEEVVVVLGHELQHVSQFRTGMFWEIGREAAEIDAETVGQGRLAAWKRR